jgi:hypothetical protein
MNIRHRLQLGDSNEWSFGLGQRRRKVVARRGYGHEQ